LSLDGLFLGNKLPGFFQNRLELVFHDFVLGLAPKILAQGFFSGFGDWHFVLVLVIKNNYCESQ